MPFSETSAPRELQALRDYQARGDGSGWGAAGGKSCECGAQVADGFGVQVDLSRFFTDERRTCWMWVVARQPVGWLAARLAERLSLPHRASPVALLAPFGLLHPADPLALLSPGDIVRVIPVQSILFKEKSLRLTNHGSESKLPGQRVPLGTETNLQTSDKELNEALLDSCTKLLNKDCISSTKEKEKSYINHNIHNNITDKLCISQPRRCNTGACPTTLVATTDQSPLQAVKQHALEMLNRYEDTLDSVLLSQQRASSAERSRSPLRAASCKDASANAEPRHGSTECASGDDQGGGRPARRRRVRRRPRRPSPCVDTSSQIEAQENSRNNVTGTANSESSSYFEELGQGYQSESPVKKKKFLSPKKTLAKTVRTPTGEVLEAVNKLESMAQNIRQDEFDIFGQYVANQLRNLPLINAIIECQNFVTNYLSQERIKYLSTSRPTSSASDNTRDELIRRPLSRPTSSASDSTRDELIRRPPSRPMSSASDNTRDEFIRRPPSRTLSSASDSARDELSRRPTSTPTGSKLIRGTLKSQHPNATITSSAYESLHGPSASPVDVDIEENFFGDNTCDELIHRPTTTPTGSKLIRGTLKSQLPNATITSSAYESLHRPSASPVDIEENFFGDSVNSKKGENLDILSQAVTTSLGTDLFYPTSFNDMNDF